MYHYDSIMTAAMLHVQMQCFQKNHTSQMKPGRCHSVRILLHCYHKLVLICDPRPPGHVYQKEINY